MNYPLEILQIIFEKCEWSVELRKLNAYLANSYNSITRLKLTVKNRHEYDFICNNFPYSPFPVNAIGFLPSNLNTSSNSTLGIPLCKIVSLMIGRNTIVNMGNRKIFDKLMNNTTITSLKLGFSCIQTIDDNLFISYLSQNRTLTSLDLSDNNIHNNIHDIQPAFADRFFSILKDNCTLKSLNLDGCGLCDMDIIKLADVLESNSTLTHLNLDHNYFEVEGMLALISILKTNKSITSLHCILHGDFYNFNFNSFFNDVVISSLLTTLKDNSTLKALYIGYGSSIGPLLKLIINNFGIELFWRDM